MMKEIYARNVGVRYKEVMRMAIEIIIRKLPKKLMEEWRNGNFSFIDFVSNGLGIPPEDIEAGLR